MKRDWVMNFLKWQILLYKPLVTLGMPFNIFSFGINFILLLPMRKLKMFTILLVRSEVSMTKSQPWENPKYFFQLWEDRAMGVQRYNSVLTAVHLLWVTEKLKQGF